MLNHNNIPSHLACYIIIGFLMACMLYMGYRMGAHEAEMSSLRTQRNWTEGENEEYKKLHKQYAEALQYYQNILKNARQMVEDVTVTLKKGTIVIPPTDQPNPSS